MSEWSSEFYGIAVREIGDRSSQKLRVARGGCAVRLHSIDDVELELRPNRDVMSGERLEKL